ncbi:MAG: leucine-rich repeat domain-containing protein, partial [Bacteroidia bacterium]|nr:leucine-rich repeat domain-containing protein [Bacteroidia bacterium]
IADLYSIRNKTGFEIDSAYSYSGYEVWGSNTNCLDRKLYDFLCAYNETDLRSFTVRRKKVYDEIQQLINSGKIVSLNLNGCLIHSLYPIGNNKELQELNLGNSFFQKHKEITFFKKLKSLDLSGTRISSTDSLPYLDQLISLNVRDNSISDLKFLARFPLLERLDISTNPVTEINDLGVLKHLKVLDMSANKIYDLSPLKNLDSLEELFMNNLSTNAGAIVSLKNLKALSLEKCDHLIGSLLSGKNIFPLLENLNLQSSSLYDINFIYTAATKENPEQLKFPALKIINLNSNEITDTQPFAKMPELEQVSLRNNKLTHTTGLSQLKKLKRLYLNNNYLYEISCLDSLFQLEELNISENINISDFKPLTHLTNLTVIILSGTRFNNLDLISSANSLKTLEIKGCKIKSYTGIKKFVNLEEITVSNMTMTSAQYFKELKKLKVINLHTPNTGVYEFLKKTLPGLTIEMSY